MADTFTTLLGARKQETGANENTWGDLLNQDTIDVFDDAIAGTESHAVTGGTYTPSSPLQAQTHVFTGTLTSDLTVVIPNLSKRMLVFNNTSGDYFMLMKTSAGTAVCIPQGTMKGVYCDGSNNVYREDADKVGEIFYHGGTTAPPGAFVADGSAKSRTLTVDLFDEIGTTWGPGNGATTYDLPDLVTDNRYLRAAGGSLSVGDTQGDEIKQHNHTASATTSVTIAGNGAHGHNITDPGHSHTAPAGQAFLTSSSGITVAGGNNYAFAAATESAVTGISIHAVGDHDHSASASTSVTVNNTGGTETRPKTAVALACIRY